MNFYPMTFRPIVKDRIWGGTKLQSELNKSIGSETSGESWELSSVSGDVSLVANGGLAGENLADLIEKYPDEILGTMVHSKFGKQFPLLFKFIDAKQDLSIQVHPDDKLAQKRHNSFGKTEMWYIMQADPGSRIIVGFKNNSSSEDYLKNLENKTLPEILNEIPVTAGDSFFLETGTIHAIGGGILLAEIQQTSDITYRIYDWDRVDDQGNSRQLHVDEALDAMNYNVIDAAVRYERNVNQANKMIKCPYFTTNFIPLDGKISSGSDGGSFTVLMCVEGNFTVESQRQKSAFKKGDTILLPAAITNYSLSGKASLLQIYIS